MSRRRKALYLFLGLTLVLALLAAHMVAELRRGEDIFWLAELWAPAAVLSIGLVTGIEFLMPPKGHGSPAVAVVEVPAVLEAPMEPSPLPKAKTVKVKAVKAATPAKSPKKRPASKSKAA